MSADEKEPAGKAIPKPADFVTVLRDGGLGSMFDLSNFDLNAMLRGAQLTFVGGTL